MGAVVSRSQVSRREVDRSQREAARFLAAFLALVRDGAVSAGTRREQAMVRRLEGAVAALDAAAKP